MQKTAIRGDRKLHKLRYWREVVGLKQDDLAVLIGCKKANYCQKELGKTEIRRTEMLKIQSAINRRLAKNGHQTLTLDDIFLP